MLTIKNFENISNIPILNDTWMLYSRIPTKGWYSFLILKNHSLITPYPNYDMKIYRERNDIGCYKVTIDYNIGNDSTSTVVFQGDFDDVMLSDKMKFIEKIEMIIEQHKKNK